MTRVPKHSNVLNDDKLGVTMKTKICGIRAIYLNNEYEFTPLKGGMCLLRSNNPKDIENGFVQLENREFVKWVHPEDLESVFELESTVIYGGDKFEGATIVDEKIALCSGSVALYKKYNMNMVDRLDYWFYVDLKDVDEIIEKRTPLPQYMKTRREESKFFVDRNTISVNGRNAVFGNDIAVYLQYGDTLIVVFDVGNTTEHDNVCCVDEKAKVIWRIQDAQELFSDISEKVVYFSIRKYLDNSIVCSDFIGRRFIIDPNTGKITGRMTDWTN
jgi:hypothetical protein